MPYNIVLRQIFRKNTLYYDYRQINLHLNYKSFLFVEQLMANWLPDSIIIVNLAICLD